jgi:hypothetical protein
MIGIMLVAVCSIAIIVGSLLLVIAAKMPSHTDERRAAELTKLYEQNYARAPEKLELIKEEIAALRTSKWRLYDAGLDICLFSTTLLVGIICFGLWDARNSRTITTPRTRSQLLGLASVAWLTLLPALQLLSEDGYASDDLTPTIDTGHGSLLIFGTAVFILLLIFILLVGRFLVLRRASFPANLWCWDCARRRRSLVVTAFFGLLAVMQATLIIWSISNFPWAIPSLIIGLYVILSSRAALVNVGSQI